jgi:serine protease Do
MGDSDKLRIGEWVLAIGNPFSENLEHTVTAGIVSAKGRSNVLSFRRRRYEDFIQTDAAINPGNSGGALINLDGELVGINTAIATDGFSRSNAGVGFSIPINLVKRITGDLIADGSVTRAYLGVFIMDLKPGTAKAFNLKQVSGAVVTQVVDDSPADAAGLQETDVILKVDNITIDGASHLTNVISTSRPGDKRKFTINRAGKTRTVSVKLKKLPTTDVAETDYHHRDDNANYGDLGIQVADLDAREARRYDIEAREGVLVIDVDPRSDAAREGLRPGDVVVRVGDKNVEDVSGYRKAIRPYHSGDTVLLRVARGEGFLFFGVEKS